MKIQQPWATAVNRLGIMIANTTLVKRSTRCKNITPFPRTHTLLDLKRCFFFFLIVTISSPLKEGSKPHLG